MALALEAHWPGPLEGLVVTRYGYQQPCQRIESVQAAYPVPDAAGLAASRRIAEMITGLTASTSRNQCVRCWKAAQLKPLNPAIFA